MERGQIFQGENGAQFEALADAPGIPLLDGTPMKSLVENTVDAAKEKHVPVIEKIEGGYRVNIGAVPHPMEEKHYIVWIELRTDNGQTLRQYLRPGDAPTATFLTTAQALGAREFCNIHGLWKA